MSVSQELEELARIGYHAYGETTDFKNYQGLPMPEWANLPEKIQTAWMAATLAIAKKTVKKTSESIAKTIIDDVVESFGK